MLTPFYFGSGGWVVLRDEVLDCLLTSVSSTY